MLIDCPNGISTIIYSPMLKLFPNYNLRPVGRWAIYTALAVLPLAAIPAVLAVRDGKALSEALSMLLFVDASICLFPAALAMLASFPLGIARRTRGIAVNLMAYGASLALIVFGAYGLMSLLGP